MDGVWLYLAPLAGVTDAAMREVCREQGAQAAYTEMVSAKALSYKNEKTFGLLEKSPAEKQVGVQLFGSEPDVLADTAKMLQDSMGESLSEININMGCPVPKVVNNGEGCALMRQPAVAEKIIRGVSRAVSLPVTVKIRKGFDDATVNAVEFSKMAEQAGACMIAVHGRTRQQFYSGKADWDIIKAVKQAVGVKVVGNGDIFCAQDAADMLAYTGCDGVMVARGAQGNPFLFAQICERVEQGKVKTNPTQEERIGMCLRQARLAAGYKDEYSAIRQMRTHAQHYTKGMKDSAKLRAALVQVETYAGLEKILYGYLEKNIAF
ncbi:tRNA dihydrouridine synthase DusB [Christensenellaceae bacterium OttesenSCG-928-K19]|nr:tRNA dihydrouridine synthase DusB [Christensenellaceae bacterium OttesenSCG-928-K19]